MHHPVFRPCIIAALVLGACGPTLPREGVPYACVDEDVTLTRSEAPMELDPELACPSPDLRSVQTGVRTFVAFPGHAVLGQSVYLQEDLLRVSVCEVNRYPDADDAPQYLLAFLDGVPVPTSSTSTSAALVMEKFEDDFFGAELTLRVPADADLSSLHLVRVRGPTAQDTQFSHFVTLAPPAFSILHTLPARTRGFPDDARRVEVDSTAYIGRLDGSDAAPQTWTGTVALHYTIDPLLAGEDCGNEAVQGRLIVLDGPEPIAQAQPLGFRVAKDRYTIRVDLNVDALRHPTVSLLELRSLGEPSIVLDAAGEGFERQTFAGQLRTTFAVD